MKNVVSFETARALKAAGFSQPLPEIGGFWYYPIRDKNILMCCYGVNDTEAESLYLFAYSVKKDMYYVRQVAKWESEIKNLVFAPAATDLLIPHCFIICEISYKTKSGERWVIYDRETLDLINKTDPDTDNPAEAAAAAWLSQHKK